MRGDIGAVDRGSGGVVWILRMRVGCCRCWLVYEGHGLGDLEVGRVEVPRGHRWCWRWSDRGG